MIYLSGTQKIQDYWISVLSGNSALSILANFTDIFDVQLNHGDIFVLSSDYFENIEDILTFYQSLPQNLNVIFITQNLNLAEGTLLIKKGIKSYCYTFVDELVLNKIIETVSNGDTWVYPALMNYIIKQIDIKPTSKKDVLKNLTDKERYVAILVASGDSNQEIANSLDVALVTVKKHISSIFKKLGLKDRVSLSILVNS